MEKRQGEFGFEIKDENGSIVTTDTNPDNGGSNYGFRPMQLLLAGLGSCSAIDMVSILNKQRQTIKDFKIIVTGEREPEKIPALWQKVHVAFELTGEIEQAKAEKAATLSIEKYCSVAETLRRAGATIAWSVIVTT